MTGQIPPAVQPSTRRQGRYENRALMKIYHVWCFIHGRVDVAYHWHREMEILFVLRGRFRLIVDGELHELSKDDLIIINADVPHNSVSMSEDALICGLHLDMGYFERRGLPGFGARIYRSQGPEEITSAIEAIKALMARLSLIDQMNVCAAALRETLALMLATTIYCGLPQAAADIAASVLRRDSHGRILRIMDQLDAGQDDFSLAAIAASEHVTVSHLSRLFKRQLGIGFRDYQINLRLDAAAEELRVTGDTIAVIMERRGFGNPAVFYRKFRERFGSTPSNFRKDRSAIGISGQLSRSELEEAQTMLARHADRLGWASDVLFGSLVPVITPSKSSV